MKRIFVLAVLLLVVLPFSIASFSGSKSYAVSQNSQDAIVHNYYSLKEAVPPAVYSYTQTRIERYNKQHNTKMHYTIKNDQILRAEHGYTFLLIPDDGSKSILVDVDIDNYGNFFAITVTIDGKIQDIS